MIDNPPKPALLQGRADKADGAIHGLTRAENALLAGLRYAERYEPGVGKRGQFVGLKDAQRLLRRQRRKGTPGYCGKLLASLAKKKRITRAYGVGFAGERRPFVTTILTAQAAVDAEPAYIAATLDRLGLSPTADDDDKGQAEALAKLARNVAYMQSDQASIQGQALDAVTRFADDIRDGRWNAHADAAARVFADASAVLASDSHAAWTYDGPPA